MLRQVTGHFGREEAKKIQIRKFIRFDDAIWAGRVNCEAMCIRAKTYSIKSLYMIGKRMAQHATTRTAMQLTGRSYVSMNR
jgi:hypothetical protein